MSSIENTVFRLRELKKKDAELMLEWMHDRSVVEYLHTDFSRKTLEDCLRFIHTSVGKDYIHLAIVDEADEYLGTVSLRNIQDGTAEFAITVRRRAMGSGASTFAMCEIVKTGFEEMGLRQIYWCVAPENKRAVRFYEKSGYEKYIPEAERLSKQSAYSIDEIRHYIWYKIERA